MIEVLKQMVEALEWCHGGEPIGTAEAIKAGKKLIAELESQEQGEPVIDKSAAIRIATALGWTPPEQERNFCPRCGKRTNYIHTCTPPRDNT